MTTPIQQVGRNRSQVMTGAPDVKYSGGFWIGDPVYDPEQFPKSAKEEGNEAAARFGAVSAGFITREGVNENSERSTDKILDWNLDVIDVVTTDFSTTLTVTFAESMNAAVLKFIYGDENVTVDDEAGEVYIRKTADDLPTKSLMFDLKGKNGARGRGFAAEATVQTVGEIAYVKDGLIQYQTTIDVLNDVTGAFLHTWFSKGGVTRASRVEANTGSTIAGGSTVNPPAPAGDTN